MNPTADPKQKRSYKEEDIEKDRLIVEALIRRDEQVTQQFFFTDCKPLFLSVINKTFNYPVDYDEFVGELYLHLMEDDARRLRTFSFKSSLFGWLKMVATNYFRDKRDRLIENRSTTPLMEKRENSYEMTREEAHDDLQALLDAIPHKRYRDILQRLIVEGADPEDVAEEMGVTIANVYNIKKRAMTALLRVALPDIKNYGKK